MMSEGFKPDSPEGCARPELMPIDVWTHRRKGELWMTTLNRFRLVRPLRAEIFSASSFACSRMLLIWFPTCRACVRPPYVRGGS